MSGPADLSIGDLIDLLSIENVRLWHLNDTMAQSTDDAVVAKATRTMLKANARRVALRNEIVRRLDGAGGVGSERTYGA